MIEAKLPFDPEGESPIIMQGFNGIYSHHQFSVRSFNYDLRYALDFALPYGTEVLAARRGKISRVLRHNDCYEGKDLEKGVKISATSVLVRHDDLGDRPFVSSFYQHLDPENIFVDVGDTVEAGQLIAKTGPTGWVGETPHLHLNFQCRRLRSMDSQPFRFRDYKESLQDEDCVRRLVGDTRPMAQHVLAIRRRDGFSG